MKNPNAEPLPRCFRKQLDKIHQEQLALEEKVVQRVEYILSKVLDKAGLQGATIQRLSQSRISKLSEDGETIDIDSFMLSDKDGGYISPGIRAARAIINGKEMKLLSDIPARWLTDFFEKEMDTGMATYQAKEEREKQEAAKREKEYAEISERRRALIEAAKSKLSKEELDLIRASFGYSTYRN